MSEKLNRYTTLPVLIDLLRRKKLVLLSPEKWEDKNDSELMQAYKVKKNLSQLYAVCFSVGEETIHHWTAFAGGQSGCCIEFDKKKLLKIVKKIEGIRAEPVKYKRLAEVEGKRWKIDCLPFRKRWPYRCEEEFRIIFESKNPSSNGEFFDIDIDLEIINKITINQKMPEQVYQTIKEYLTGEIKNPEKRINKSTLYQNKRWISTFSKK